MDVFIVALSVFSLVLCRPCKVLLVLVIFEFVGVRACLLLVLFTYITIILERRANTQIEHLIVNNIFICDTSQMERVRLDRVLYLVETRQL